MLREAGFSLGHRLGRLPRKKFPRQKIAKQRRKKNDFVIKLISGALILKLMGQYRIWTPDPDPWELRSFGSSTVVWNSGDWVAIRSIGEARFMADVLDIYTMTTTHDIVLKLFFPPTDLPGFPFSVGATGTGRAGATSIHYSIPPSGTVSYEVISVPWL